jgi:hypothetical protein
VLKRDGSTGGCRAAQLAMPNTAPNIAKNISIAAHILILVRRVVDDRVDSTREIPGYLGGDENLGSDIGQSWGLRRGQPGLVYRSLLGWHD